MRKKMMGGGMMMKRPMYKRGGSAKKDYKLGTKFQGDYKGKSVPGKVKEFVKTGVKQTIGTAKKIGEKFRTKKMGGGMIKRNMYQDGSPKTLLRRIGPEESKRMAQDPSRKKRMNDMMLRYPKGKQVDPETREKLKKLLDSKKPKTMRKKMMGGGSLKPVDPKTQKGLSKLPTKVRNKMGFMKKGGKVK